MSIRSAVTRLTFAACAVMAFTLTQGQAGLENAPTAAETVILPPGSFTHSLPGEYLKAGHPVSAPRIVVEIDEPLEIMKYQVAAADYQRCVRRGRCRPADAPDGDDVPTTGVSHGDAEDYAAWYSSVTGDAWRLPTDTEWAYAAAERYRGDIESAQVDPDNPASRWLALYRAESALDRKPDAKPRPQGAFGTNSKGVADIAGNVWEWTSTCYVHATVMPDGQVAADELDNCGVRVVEGFHRTYMSNFIRDGKSGGCAVGTPPDNLGFRLVKERMGPVRKAFRLLGLS